MNLVHLSRLRFFERVFDSAGVGAVISDADGQIVDANRAAEQFLGWNAGELAGRRVPELVPPGRAPILLSHVLEAGGRWSGPLQLRRKSGAINSAHLEIRVVHDENGEPIATVGFLSDDWADRRRSARLQSLAALGAALNAEPELPHLLERICQEAHALFGVSGVYLTRYDEQANELVGLASSGGFARPAPEQRTPLPSREDQLAEAIFQRRPVIIHDVQPEGSYVELIRLYQVKACLLAPLVRGDRVLGLLALLDAERGDRFGPEDAELAQAFAELAAVAIEDARLHAAERKRNERLLALAQINALLNERLERAAVLEAITAGARRLLDVEEVLVWRLAEPGGPLRLAHFASACAIDPDAELNLNGSRMGQVMRSGETWQIPDIWSDRMFHRHARLHPDGEACGLRGCLMIPLIAHGRPLGGITIFSRQVRTFDAEDVELAQAFGHQAALAVQHAETLARQRQASRLEQLVARARRLPPRDRRTVEQILDAAERLVELGESCGFAAESGVGDQESGVRV